MRSFSLLCFVAAAHNVHAQDQQLRLLVAILIPSVMPFELGVSGVRQVHRAHELTCDLPAWPRTLGQASCEVADHCLERGGGGGSGRVDGMGGASSWWATA